MSFNQLPEELVAQVASKLNHTDLLSLRMSQKRMNDIVKRFKLVVYKFGVMDRPYPELSALNGKKHRVIHSLVLKRNAITENLLEAITKIEAKIQNLVFEEYTLFAPPNKFIEFKKKFNNVYLSNEHLYWTDEVFCQMLDNVTFDFNKPAASHFTKPLLHRETKLTDAVLTKMLSGRVPDTFLLARYGSKFSLSTIRKWIQKALDFNYKRVNWNFGFIGWCDKDSAAEDLMTEVNDGQEMPLKVQRSTVERFDGFKYTITHTELAEEKFKIVFHYNEQSKLLAGLTDQQRYDKWCLSSHPYF